jgi:hypothetical protein
MTARAPWIACLVAVSAAACSRSPPSPPADPIAGPVRAAAPALAPVVPTDPAETPAVAPPRPSCGDSGHVLVFVSPEHPTRGKAIDARLVLSPPSASSSARPQVIAGERRGGPPYYWLAQVEAPAVGAWHATFSRDVACGGEVLAKRDAAVAYGRTPAAPAPPGALWAVRAAWSGALENLYSTWIDHLFDAPLDVEPSWSALHEVLRDRSRNFLFDHLGENEDELGIVVMPDCADLPYFLRAYFSFKLGLPFGWSRCSRGEGGTPPTCSDFATNLDPFPPVDGKPQFVPAWAEADRPRDGPDAGASTASAMAAHGRGSPVARRFGEFLRTTLADAAQSGAGRTSADDETGDYYPVTLSVETLRPGTIFADPYGHVLVVARRIAQTPDRGGILLAVDGQPDGTVARKRFWRGNFLFAIDPSLGSAGFKRFRPIVRNRAGRAGTVPAPPALRRLADAELADFSVEQGMHGVEGFYDKVEDVLSPAPLDPMQALLETVQALDEQVETRVVSVDNGRRFLASGKRAAEMPDGAKIFETTGDWEDFSTPSRDLRLLIAIDVARGLPSRIARRTERYAMPAGKTPDAVTRELEQRIGRELDARTFKYTRSDGTSWQLRLADVLARQEALEMAYNPNDCVEARWGAPAGSDEASTCMAHAPEAQVAKMQGYRAWFHGRVRPPR